MKFFNLLLIFTLLIACGRTASDLLRQGQIPLNDFPLYLSQSGGSLHKVWKYDRNGSGTLLASDSTVAALNNPQGIATDKFLNLYVADQGNNRVVKLSVTSGEILESWNNLQSPNLVAVDDFGDPYAAQGATNNIIRLRDNTEIASYSSRIGGFTFGVDGILLVALFDEGKVEYRYQGKVTGTVEGLTEPNNISTDGTARVYIAEGSFSGASIFRFFQRSPIGQVTLASSLSAPSGIAVDPVGNVYFVEAGGAAIRVATHDGLIGDFIEGISNPRYLTFTQY